MTDAAVVLVTGASRGLGLAIARALADRGHVVYAGARQPAMLDGERGITPLPLDVTDPASVRVAVELIHDERGRVDVLVNNAGYGQYGSVEDVADEVARRQFDVNVFGVATMCRAVLPGMRSRGSGRIITISSVAGRMSTQFAGWYAASKFAVEALHDALRLEVAPLGLRVSLIEPAAVTSGFDETALRELEERTRTEAYRPAVDAFADAVRRSYRHAANPDVVARAVTHAVESSRPRTRYPVPRAAAGTFVLARRLLGDRAMDGMLRSQLGPRASDRPSTHNTDTTATASAGRGKE